MTPFKLIKSSKTTAARAGILKTAHGEIETPVFMPVGTQATVKALAPEDLESLGAQIILGNTYHLYLRPGCKVIEKFKGLHDFMHWQHPILTDSGGFQVFSLSKLAKITEEGYAFQSHLDGGVRHMLTPEKAVEVQLTLNSDIMMCLDQCMGYPESDDRVARAVDLTTRWARRCKQAWQAADRPQNLLFGIVQGAMYEVQRSRSAAGIVDLDFPGYALGGLSVGEPKELMLEMADHTLQLLPEGSPRYIMGVGTPADLVDLVALGADMFDCVMPTRNARNGQLFTAAGAINIANGCHRQSQDPIESGCGCYTCQHYSRAYLRHLYLSKEILVHRLTTIHNLYFYLNLVKQMRRAIIEDRFEAFRKDFHARYQK
jgi:queuine tRNA-ribosyltransferase